MKTLPEDKLPQVNAEIYCWFLFIDINFIICLCHDTQHYISNQILSVPITYGYANDSVTG